MKLGIIGMGMIVQEFLPELVGLPELDIRCLLATKRSENRARQLAAQFGIPAVVTSFEELAACGLDAVYIAVPNHLHAVYVRQALEAGLHVIVEKPMVSTETEARDLARLAAEKGRYLLEAVTVSLLPGYARIREWLPLIGDVKFVSCQYLQYSRRYDAFVRGDILPVFDPARAGGALMDLNVYNLHFVLGLFGQPEAFAYDPVIERDIDTGGSLVMEYPGFQAVCSAAKTCSGPSGCLIAGTRGTIRTSQAANTIGSVELALHSGQQETFVPGPESRAAWEFGKFADIITGCRDQEAANWLERSLAAAHIMTQSRLENGIRFPADCS